MSATAVAPAPRARRGVGRGRLVALLAAAVLVAAGTYAAVALTGGDDAPVLPRAGTPALLTADLLAAVADATGHDVYGIATPAGARPEVTRGSDGEVWVRYLTGDAKIGDARADYLTIGTYPRADALAAAKAAAAGEQTRSADLPDGGVMLWNLERPESVYAASPGSALLVEVYSPDPQRARALVSGGAVSPLR